MADDARIDIHDHVKAIADALGVPYDLLRRLTITPQRVEVEILKTRDVDGFSVSADIVRDFKVRT